MWPFVSHNNTDVGTNLVMLLPYYTSDRVILLRKVKKKLGPTCQTDQFFAVGSPADGGGSRVRTVLLKFLEYKQLQTTRGHVGLFQCNLGWRVYAAHCWSQQSTYNHNPSPRTHFVFALDSTYYTVIVKLVRLEMWAFVNPPFPKRRTVWENECWDATSATRSWITHRSWLLEYRLSS